MKNYLFILAVLLIVFGNSCKKNMNATPQDEPTTPTYTLTPNDTLDKLNGQRTLAGIWIYYVNRSSLPSTTDTTKISNAQAQISRISDELLNIVITYETEKMKGTITDTLTRTNDIPDSTIVFKRNNARGESSITYDHVHDKVAYKYHYGGKASAGAYTYSTYILDEL